MCVAISALGRLNLLHRARENDFPLDKRTCSTVAKGEHLGVLQWARSNGCSWSEDTCSSAAEGGALQWARSNGCLWNATTCFSAAKGGHLGVLQWARSNGCPWNTSTCSMAAEGGHLGVLQWARCNGCPWVGRLARELPEEGISVFFSGHGLMSILGILTPALVLPYVGIWALCSGRGPMAVDQT